MIANQIQRGVRVCVCADVMWVHTHLQFMWYFIWVWWMLVEYNLVMIFLNVNVLAFLLHLKKQLMSLSYVELPFEGWLKFFDLIWPYLTHTPTHTELVVCLQATFMLEMFILWMPSAWCWLVQGEGMSALSILESGMHGPSFEDDTACTTCGESKAQKTCSACKSVSRRWRNSCKHPPDW